MTPDIEITGGWFGVWFSRWDRAAILKVNVLNSAIDTGERPAITKAYKHSRTGQIRLYSPLPLHDRLVSYNDRTFRVVSRGRFGKLYLEE